MTFDTILTPEVSRLYTENGYWLGKNLLEYFDAAVARTPDKTAVVESDTRVTYGELDAEVNRVAARLKALGIRKGDVISIQLYNTPEFVTVHLAATRLGAVTNPLLHNYRASELSYILRLARTVAVFIPEFYRKFDYPTMYAEMWPELPELKHVFVLAGEGKAGMTSFEALRTPEGATSERVPTEPFSGDDITALIFTSGTESKPKGVMHSHNTQMYGTLNMAKLLGLTTDDVVWAPSPIGHGTGFEWGVRQAITLGATLVLQDVWNADEALRLIARERCSFTLSATPFAAMLVESPLLGTLDLSSFRTFASAGAAIPHKLGMDMRTRVGCELIGMWGMSECFVGSASPIGDPEEKLWGTDGKAMPGGELAIFDETRSRMLSPGETGELGTRGPHVALGYFNDPERTRDTFSSDGWLFSNDLATMDADGYIRLVGRKKEIINRGGLKISVRQMEEYLLNHPNVLNVAMVGVPDKLLGEKSCAFIVTRNGAEMALRELTDFLEEHRVAKYKFPEYLVRLPEMPSTPSGKIQKYVLRDGFMNGTYTVLSR
jgi:acyl-coenzyme A synthetase/AMP-(fatty) acid ligase